ncbi:MAG: AAA family ATPase, partial [Syntrophomonas sp.]
YKFQIMDKILAPLRQRYEFIFIDCPPSFNFVTLNALYASDYYLIPTRLDELSTYGLEAIIKRVNDMNDLFRGQVADYRPVSLAGIVPNSVRLYRQGPVASQVNILERLCTGMGTDVFPVYVTEGEGIPTAVQGGFPVYGLTNSSKARDQAGEMLEVLRELLDRVTGGAS